MENNGIAPGTVIYLIVQTMFVVFKSLDIIDWSWWSVFIPTFVVIALNLLVLILGAIFIGVLEYFDRRRENKRR